MSNRYEKVSDTTKNPLPDTSPQKHPLEERGDKLYAVFPDSPVTGDIGAEAVARVERWNKARAEYKPNLAPKELTDE